MSKWFKYFLVAVFAVTSIGVSAQKQKKRPPKSENTQTRADAQKKDAANRARKEEEYRMKVGKHHDIQDKSTKKRMKQNYKKAQKQSIGREVPFYKRWFRKRKV